MGDVKKNVQGFLRNATPAGLVGAYDDNSKDALAAQRQAAEQSNATQTYIFNQQREDNQPWREAGGRAINQLADGDFQRDFTMADFQADPGYQFRMAEGAKALERSAAARGGLSSGGTLKALTRYGQDFASNEYTNAYNRFNNDRTQRFNRLSNIAGIGQTANAQVGQAGQNYANQVSQNQIGVGNAAAAASIAQGNRMSDLMNAGVQGMVMASDARLKTNIERISPDELAEMKKHLRPYRFNYVDESLGEGDWVGILAQDLEKSKLGRTLVVTDENGFKHVDMKKAVSVFLASMAEG